MAKRIIQNRFDSKTDFRTPEHIFNGLNSRFGPFTLDAAASPENHLCFAYYDESRSALERDWFGRVWVNPPYNNIRPWAEHAIKQIEEKNVQSVTFLVPASTCSQWFKMLWDHWSCDEIIFITGRLQFRGPHAIKNRKKAPAPNPSVVIHLERDGAFRRHLIQRIDRELI